MNLDSVDMFHAPDTRRGYGDVSWVSVQKQVRESAEWGTLELPGGLTSVWFEVQNRPDGTRCDLDDHPGEENMFRA